MPRKRSPNKSYFHFCLYLTNGNRKYFYTAAQIATDLSISRSSVYRALRTNNKLFEYGIIKKEYLHHSIVEHLVKKELQMLTPFNNVGVI